MQHIQKMTSTPGVLVDDHVLEVLRKAHLDAFMNKFIFQFNVRHFEHFSHVRDKDMQDIGMQQQQIRQLRDQILKMSRELWNRSDPKQVYVQADQSTPVQNTIDEKALIPNDQIRLYELLGEGTFAVVKRGTWTPNNGQKIDVAVKILRDISPNIMDDLRVEASHLLKLQHPSLIRLYGIVRQPAMMVFELCEGGSLLDRLRDDKKPIPLVSRLHDYCMQIAKALQFLESKHCVHRDVAARNILVAKDEKTVKICDFGLMRALKENEQMYTMAPQKKVPFAWCPPEALRHRKFSHASDVWSYGVTIWEIFTFGEEPWVGCRAIDVLKNIDAGERLEKPKYCSEKIYLLMQKCWKTNPAERCKFGSIREDLKAAMFLEAVAREVYKSIQPGTLSFVKGDEVVVIENEGQDWYGQAKKTLQFGTFPRTAVFAQANHAVAAQTAVTPQKLPTAPTISVPPQQPIQPPSLPFHPKPINNNSITSVNGNDRRSRISMPVAGSFIHTGHGDPFGQNSWGNPSNIDQMYLKNPVKGAPLSSTSNGAEIIASKEQLTNGGKSTFTPVAPTATTTKLRSLSLDMPEYDDFERALDDGFSPSKIELPRAIGNESIVSNGANRSSNLSNFILLEGPKPVEPKFDIRGNVLMPTPIQKPTSVNNSAKPILVAPSNTGATSMQFQDVFSAPQRSSMTNPPIYPVNIQNSSTSAISSPANNSRAGQALPTNLLPELQSRLDNGMSMRPRPASSIGIQNSGLEFHNGIMQRPFSVVNVPTAKPVQQTTTIPCLVPTPAPSSTQKVPASQQNPLQTALNKELKGNLDRRRTTSITSATQTQRNGVSVNSQPALQPQKVSPSSLQSQNRNPYQPQQVRLPPVTTAPTTSASSNAVQASPVAAVPRPPEASIAQPTKPVSAPVPAQPNPTTSSNNVVIRRPTSTNTQLSDEERRSKIIMDINNALGAPSSLLLGSTSSLPNATPSAPSLTTTSSAQKPQTIKPSQPQPTMPPKKTSEPILSTEVLQPTRLNTATTSMARPVSQPVQQPTRNVEPLVINNTHPVAVNKKPDMANHTSNVPLFNITNSTNLYPQLGSYPNYANGYQPYGYGMQQNNGGYYGYQGYNPYANAMGQLALTHSAMSSLPPLAPSENRFSGTAQQLGESDIIELLGQNRPPATASVHSTPTTSNSNDVSMAEKMEILYKEADFTKRGNCDTMVMNCKGDTELALKVLKQQHLVDIGVANNRETACRALEARQYDLTAAANMLLG
uniref:non-specific protein-tyrosine kinase n=2 Tax=Caenorhabditis japonica TaxID=281687 RepID=A0A8R1DWA7_CAEJA